MITMNASYARPSGTPGLAASPLDINSYQDAVFAALKAQHSFTEKQIAENLSIGQLIAHCHSKGTPIHEAAASIAAKQTIDLTIPADWDRSNPAVRARLAPDRPATTGAAMDPFGKNAIRQPKDGSKEAGTRKLREDADKAAKAEPKPAPAPKPEPAPKAPASPAPKPKKESTVSTSTKKTPKPAGKPVPGSKKPAPGTERRKKPARTSGARKPAVAKVGKSPNKGESVIALISKGWTKMSVVTKESGWLAHTARAFFSRARKPVKDGGLGQKVEHRNEGGEAEYRIAK